MNTEQRLNKLADAGKIYWYRIEDGVASIASSKDEKIEPVEFALNSLELEQFLQKNEESK